MAHEEPKAMQGFERIGSLGSSTEFAGTASPLRSYHKAQGFEGRLGKFALRLVLN